jgi:hypothetical protein
MRGFVRVQLKLLLKEFKQLAAKAAVFVNTYVEGNGLFVSCENFSSTCKLPLKECVDLFECNLNCL